MRLRLLSYCGMLLAIAVFVSELRAGEVTGLTLVNADNNQAIGALNDGDTIDLSKVGGELNVRADVSGQVGSARFAYDKNDNYRTESTAPFAFEGDTEGNYGSWSPSSGKHTIVATPFSKPRAGGEKGQPFSVSFKVVGEAKRISAAIEYPTLEDESVFRTMVIPSGSPKISGELRKWHKITLTFEGPKTSKTSTPNPFLDFRLNVLFRQGDRKYLVPGYKHPHSDLTCQDWRSRDLFWDQCRVALKFFGTHLPFAEMASHDSLTTDADSHCFAKPGEIYAIMLRPGSSTALDLGDTEATFTVRWFNPRNGGPLLVGSTKTIEGPGKKPLGTPPSDPDEDWIILVTRFGR